MLAAPGPLTAVQNEAVQKTPGCRSAVQFF